MASAWGLSFGKAWGNAWGKLSGLVREVEIDFGWRKHRTRKPACFATTKQKRRAHQVEIHAAQAIAAGRIDPKRAQLLPIFERWQAQQPQITDEAQDGQFLAFLGAVARLLHEWEQRDEEEALLALML